MQGMGQTAGLAWEECHQEEGLGGGDPGGRAGRGRCGEQTRQNMS